MPPNVLKIVVAPYQTFPLTAIRLLAERGGFGAGFNTCEPIAYGSWVSIKKGAEYSFKKCGV